MYTAYDPGDLGEDLEEPCDPNDCDGDWHTCPDCGGFGWNLDEDEYLTVTCTICKGEGGRPCPRAGVAP